MEAYLAATGLGHLAEHVASVDTTCVTTDGARVDVASLYQYKVPVIDPSGLRCVGHLRHWFCMQKSQSLITYYMQVRARG